ENQVFFTKANFLAAIGSIAGSAATITFNSNFLWDYTPPEINSGAYCFQSVAAHEVGHVLGFTSGADFRASDIEALDIYRFQNSDGNGTDHNPDDLAEFGTTARMVDQNAPQTADDVNSDLITVEYQMSDGIPNQASHFSARNPGIYVMDPSLSSGETFYPDFYRSGDSNMFDAIGWDYPPAHTSCEQAWELKCNSHKSFDSSDVSNPANPAYGCGTGAAHDGTLWYRFTATATSAGISTCDSNAQDSAFAVYAGACGSLVEIACSEDGGCGAAGLSSLCVTGLTVGETYFVQLSARTAAARGIYDLEIGCSCFGACCLPPPAHCVSFSQNGCTEIAGSWAGPDTTCDGDGNGDGFDDTCDIEQVKFSQPPTISGGEDIIASNMDWTDLGPNLVLADDFTSDG
ncbi:MAG: NF038122 family metalloprotease, partial [Chloroflexota bacterium]